MKYISTLQFADFVFVGPSDVGGSCPSGSYQYINSCCCGGGCCWDKCGWDAPPQDCLPDGAKWKLNDNLGWYQAVGAPPTTTTTTTTITTTTKGKKLDIGVGHLFQISFTFDH